MENYLDSAWNTVYARDVNLDALVVEGTTVPAEETAAVKTLTIDAALITWNSIAVSVDGVTLSEDFDSTSDTTLAAIATAIAGEDWITTAVVTEVGWDTEDDRVIVITAAVAGVDFTLANLTVTWGASQAWVVQATTTANEIDKDGYAKGCAFIDSDVASGTGWVYYNKWTNEVAVFTLVTQAA